METTISTDIQIQTTVEESSTQAKPKKEKKPKKQDGGEEADTPKDPNSVTGRWNKDEHEKFIDAIRKFGKDWKMVEQYIETRTGAQIRSHAQKFFNRLIKKYAIEKNQVIDFVHKTYNSSIDSPLQSPKKKKKADWFNAKNPKNNLYVFNEEEKINKMPREVFGKRALKRTGR